MQIGTVMTDPDYRNQGLNKILLGRILEEWQGKCDSVYLFANHTVLDFYPKFGFHRVDEYQHSQISLVNKAAIKPRRLVMTDEKDKALVIHKINHAVPVSKVSMIDNASLILFYLTSFMSDQVYYLPLHDAVVVADYQGDSLYLHDIFCQEVIPLDSVIEIMALQETTKVILGFTPLDTTSFEESIHDPDDVLFVLGDEQEVFHGVRVRYPVLSHA